jgi:hypothetical protein
MTPERWARIEEVYHEALDREESARAAFLQEECLGDEELRQPEFQSPAGQIAEASKPQLKQI